MRRLKKDYYTLPEAEERSGQRIDDLLWLAEREHIRLWVVANRWPIVWTDEREFTDKPPIETMHPIKPPFDYYYSGYLNLCRDDIRSLQVNQKISPRKVYAEKESKIFVGSVQWDSSLYFFRQRDFNFEINSVFVSREDLLRVENKEVGDWESKRELKSTEDIEREAKTEPKPTGAITDGRTARKPFTQAMYVAWQRASQKLLQEHPLQGQSKSWRARKIAKNPDLNPDNRSWQTIRGHL